ncbi:MAG: UxaA family hydrolase [Nitrospinota bacterium]
MVVTAMQIHKDDSVATCLGSVKAGEEVEILFEGKRGRRLKANQEIPYAHKVALKDLKKGESVLKYGLSIGSASANIREGDYIHVHNLESNRGRGDLAGRRSG